MNKAISMLIFIMSTYLSFGQKEHLEPAKDFSKYSGILKKYYDNVFPLLYKGFSKKPIARYTSMPSFSIEYSFSIETIEGRNYVMSNRLSKSYWYTEDKKKVKLISSKVELTNELYFKIVELFKILAEQTTKSKDETMGLDETIYYFTTTEKNGQIKIGKTWSPKENSLLDKLVNICNDVYLLGTGENISQIGTLKNIEKLIIDLKK